MQFFKLAAALAALGGAAAQTYTDGGPDARWPGSNEFGAFVVQRARPIVMARMDPIVDPGKVSGHVHSVAGAANFRNVPNTPQESAEAECASVLFQADKSNYWYPELYYIRDDGKFEAMATGVKMYYFGNGYNVQPFPQGMRIVVGTAMSRKPDFRQSYGWTCQTKNGRVGNGGFIPNGTAFPNGCDNVMMTIDFPSCGWANGSLDSWDHFSHLTFPIAQGSQTDFHNAFGMFCPPTHPIKYPTIRMEAFWEARPSQPWRSDRPVYALSNGDTLGGSAHADYVSNWDMDVLRQAISQCTYGRGPGDATAEECPPLKGSINETMSDNCRYAGKIPSEDVGLHDAIDHLPGCNPLWTADMDAKPTDCPWYTGDPGWTAPNVYWVARNPHYNILPDALLLPDNETNMTRANLEKYKGTAYQGLNTGYLYDYKGYFNGWGEYLNDEIMNWGHYFTWSNQVLVGTNKEVRDNRYGCNATDKTGTGPSAGMEDASHFTGVVPACTVDKSLWQDNVNKNPKSNNGKLQPGPIHPACGVVPKRAQKFPTPGFLGGPPVQIKDIPNDPSPYTTGYSYYGSGYWPSPFNGAPQWLNQEGKWNTVANFASAEADPAPGFNGTLTFSAPKQVKLSCPNGVTASDPSTETPVASPAPDSTAPVAGAPNSTASPSTAPAGSNSSSTTTGGAASTATNGGGLLMADPVQEEGHSTAPNGTATDAAAGGNTVPTGAATDAATGTVSTGTPNTTAPVASGTPSATGPAPGSTTSIKKCVKKHKRRSRRNHNNKSF